MDKNFKKFLNEVNRINDLMVVSENRELINESGAPAIKLLRNIIDGSINNIAKYGIKEIDNILKSMVWSKNVDEFFDLLDNIKLYDSKIAKQLRRDIFDILPDVTRNRLNRIIKDVEGKLDMIPEDQLENLLDDIINEQFPNEPESVKSFMRDSIIDNSDSISNKTGTSSLTDDISSKIEGFLTGAKETNPNFLEDIPTEAINARLKQLESTNPGKYQRHDIEFLERAMNGRLPTKPSALDQRRIQEYVNDIAEAALAQKNKWYKLNLRKDFERLSTAKTWADVAGSTIAIGAKLGLPISIPIIIMFYKDAFTESWGDFADDIFDVVLKDGFTGNWKEDFILWYSSTYPQSNMEPEYYINNPELIRVTGENPNYSVSIYGPDGRTKLVVIKTEDNGETFTVQN
jgi:hypothetical protein